MGVPEGLLHRLLCAQRIAITAHVSPEGDAIGSALALAMGLQTIGKHAEVIFHEGVPKRYAFLPDSEKVKAEPSVLPDLLVLVDLADLERADLPKTLKEEPPQIVAIDHHPNERDKGHGERDTVTWVETKAAATGEMIAELLKALGVPLTNEMATCLYAAIIADTGVFHFRNTTPKVLRLAAKLLRYGVDPQDLAYQVMEVRPFNATQLLARTLSKARFESEFGICWSALSVKDFAQTNTGDEDTENFVNFLRAVEGTKVAILFREVHPNFVKVSLRAKDNLDVAAIAYQFGGGGHLSAAGCRLQRPLRKVVRQVLQAVRKALTKDL